MRKDDIAIDLPVDRQMTIATDVSVRECMEGLEEFFWDGHASKEDLARKAEKVIEEVAETVNKRSVFHWDLRHGLLWYDPSCYCFSSDAVEDFQRLREEEIERTVHRMEKREMELADFLQEMISLGWTPDTFNEDFNGYLGDEVKPEEKDTCRRIFEYLWEDR